MKAMKRTLGYCIHSECSHHRKGVKLPCPRERFICPRCQRPGRIEWERAVISGGSDIFSEVRVDYDFDPVAGCYGERVRVRDESILIDHNTYTLQSPFIRTREFAIRAAETILRQLNRYHGPVRCGDPGRASRELGILRRDIVSLQLDSPGA